MTDDQRKLEQRLKRAVIAALDPTDRGLALQPRYRRLHELGCDPTTGFCSIAAEALWAMLGGRAAGYELVQVKHEGGPHRFVRFMPTGRVIDPTRAVLDDASVRAGPGAFDRREARYGLQALGAARPAREPAGAPAHRP